MNGIRRAVIADGPALVSLWLDLMKDQYELDPRVALASDAGKRWLNDFRVWVNESGRRMLVLEQKDQVVGFISAQRWSPPPIFSSSAEIYIDEVYVVPAFRGKGWGRKLVEEVRIWAIELKAVRLRMGVVAANEEARRFWRHLEASPLYTAMTIELPGASAQSNNLNKGKLGFL